MICFTVEGRGSGEFNWVCFGVSDSGTFMGNEIKYPSIVGPSIHRS